MASGSLMDVMELGELNILEPLGHGGCGRVFLAETADGSRRAIKFLDDSACNVDRFADACERLAAQGWPAGVMRAEPVASDTPFRIWVMPFVGTFDPSEGMLANSLQNQQGDHPGLHTWRLVRSMAKALAGMHDCGVAHGNLKPTNVFVEGDGTVLLSDWALGNQPGIGKFHFTDAVLYQSPEQLLFPAGPMAGEVAYRQDVYAFGALSYRLLADSFARCDTTFRRVAPPPRGSVPDGLKADLPKVVENLRAQAEVSWPGPEASGVEGKLRELILRCLDLDPAARPASMIAVWDEIEACDRKEANAPASSRAIQASNARHREGAGVAWFTAGTAALLAAGFGGLWYVSSSRLLAEKDARAQDARAFIAKVVEAEDRAEAAEHRTSRAEDVLAYERDRWLARLEASREVGDHLFDWALEKGHRRLPPLDGRHARLARLERYFTEFLERTSGIPELKDERARVKLQLAEVSIAAGDEASATQRLEQALQAIGPENEDPALKLRLGRDSLLLALLRHDQNHLQAGQGFLDARKTLSEVPRSQVDAAQLDEWLAILDFHEAKMFAATGRDGPALEQLMRATKTLNRLADERPDAAVLRSELAACYLSSASILEGMNQLGDAREVRALALIELRKLLAGDPGDVSLRIEIAGCLGAMAEASVLAGDTSSAESTSGEAMKLLDEVLAVQPDHAEAAARKAAQLGLRAGLLRDKGRSQEAIDDFDVALSMLERLFASNPQNSMVVYRLALLRWQKARMIGTDGAREAEITLISESIQLLQSLEIRQDPNGPAPEILQRTNAYMAGDLGHALQLVGRRGEAALAFAEAVKLWEGLSSSRPKSEEYTEALLWCRQRMQDLR